MKLTIVKTKAFNEGLIIVIDYYTMNAKKHVDNIINLLATGKKLPAKYHDHSINSGKYRNKGFRDCHIVEIDKKHDCVLIYCISKFKLSLIDIGSHKRLFPSSTKN
ncbi:MAG: type II toxin-antitoxin system YafQ family toxin [Mycoplasmataceae bacterium]|jgi:addiction module RelE/StbE family toxin|nr:type II toxin-antitoxin system YafQ family toxin [Mycoplasmataceae bacterium]